jgi:hypothetical protein
LFYNGANGRQRREPSDDVDVQELGHSSSHRPDTNHGVLRDVMLVVLRQLSLRPLLQPGVQHSIAWTRRLRLAGVQTGRDLVETSTRGFCRIANATASSALYQEELVARRRRRRSVASSDGRRGRLTPSCVPTDRRVTNSTPACSKINTEMTSYKQYTGVLKINTEMDVGTLQNSARIS